MAKGAIKAGITHDPILVDLALQGGAARISEIEKGGCECPTRKL